nr:MULTISPECIES: isochorismatase family cysteine hydrolase [unclassified Enterococcus]
MKALISIDYTNDFVADEGHLTAGKPAQAIEIAMYELTKKFINNQDAVFFTIDLHDLNDNYHPESKLFPLHNLRDTSGRLLYGKLGAYYQEIKSLNNVFWLDKRHYSAFSGTDLDIRLRERRITDLTICGVLTDICVLHTAIDAYNLGYQITIPKSAVASLSESAKLFALEHFKQVLGAKVID